jgi:hypothetical protein
LASLLLLRSFGLPLGALACSIGNTAGGSLRIVLLLFLCSMACNVGGTASGLLLSALLFLFGALS